MTRTMYDSVTAADIPTSAEMVAGYLAPSRFAWTPTDWARFPHATKVQIAVRSDTDAGHVLDVEAGDATAVEAVSWVLMRRKAGADPTIYCSQMIFPSVVGAFNAAKVPQPHYWVAHYDGQAILPAGLVAKQYTDSPASGGHYDLSVVADYWPGVDPPLPETDMELTDVLPQNPTPNTVGFVLRDLERGTAGVNSAGAMALNIIDTTSAVTSLQTTVGGIAAQLATVQSQLTALATAVAALTPLGELGGNADVSITLTPRT